MISGISSAINARYFPVYRADYGRARCRVSREAWSKDSRVKELVIGSTVVNISLKLSPSEEELIIICSLWPDSSNLLKDNEICLDSSVVLRTASSFQNIEALVWINCPCKVSFVNPLYALCSMA